ncbi:hypothetical protein ACOBQB_03450 [Streptomyces sp. G5(2025)]|uniref:hypothetical protein n=1 Tax=Streptomyces sp. G5(2025) TaxID=3406628 RepID=UPI003C299B6E
MGKSAKEALSTAGGLLLAAGCLTVGATTTASAAGTGTQGEARVHGCPDNPKSYTKAEGQRYSGVVAVCCKRSSGGDVCQSSYKLMPGGRWNVIATHVANGTQFSFGFRSTARSTGQWAA